MATKETAVRDLLKANAGWTSLVTGGTYILDELGRTGLSLETLPTAAKDATLSGALKLVCVITFGTSIEAEVLTSENQFMTLWFYHHSDRALIKQARRKAKDLLDRQQVTTTTEGHPLIRWVNDLGDFNEDELRGAMAGASRYRLIFSRQ